MSATPTVHRSLAAILLALVATALATGIAEAGIYAPAAGEEGSTAVYKDDAAFTGWASQVIDYEVGTNCESEWQDTDLCLGEPGDDVYDITCLGNGGTITLGFDKTIGNGDGWDFAVFENGFGPGFLEFAYVEVSSDGVNFVRFPNHSETASMVGAYTTSMDASNVDGLAGKYQLGYGTPFDLSDLAGVAGVEKVDLDHITRIRIVDIIGDGSCKDSDGNPIYDPYPCIGSGGFDLDAIGVRYFADALEATTTVSTSTTSVDDIQIALSGSSVRVSWPGEAGITYEVQSSTDLLTWSALKSDIAGQDATMILTTPCPAVATFYRVTED